MFGKTLRLWIVPTIAALALTVAPASATTISYASLAAWQAASTGTQNIDFQSTAPGTYASVSLAGVQFIGLGGSNTSVTIADTSLAANSWMNFFTLNALYINTQQSPTLQIQLPASVTAFGLNIYSANPHALAMTFIVNGSTFTIPTNDIGGQPTFFGVTSATPFNTVLVSLATTNSGSFIFADNVAFGTAQLPTDPTPEAATLLLIGSGLIGLMVLRKRILKNKPALQTNPVLSAC